MRANERAARSAEAVAGAHADLRHAFPRRPDETAWPASLLSAGQIIARIDTPPFRPANGSGYRRHGTTRILGWLASFPGDSWQQRWRASGAEALPKEQWLDLPMQWRQAAGRSVAPHNRDCFQAGLLMLVCADVIRPAFGWMVRKASNWIVPAMAACRDPHGYSSLQGLIDADPDGITAGQARLALGRITMILACKGGLARDITVGDYLQLLDAMHETGTGGAGRLLAYRLLHGLGHLGPDAPVTGRAFLQAAGQRSVEELVDRYQVQCRPVRDLLVDYLRERQPAVDYVSLSNLAGDLVRLFWTDLERHHPGIDSINLAPEIADAWRHRISYRPVTAAAPGGGKTEALVPRAGARSTMMTVRAFYLDIAQWALDEPHRWAQWAVPCPVKETDCNRAKRDKLVKSRMDQRTRERLPHLPALARGQRAPPGQRGPAGGGPPGPARGHLHQRRPVLPPAAFPHRLHRQHLGLPIRRRAARRPDTPGKRSLLGLGIRGSPASYRHPVRRTPRAQPPQHHPVPAALHRRAGPAAADRAVQGRRRETAAGQPRARRRPQRDRQPDPRPHRRHPARAQLRHPRENLEPAHAAAVPARHLR